jgi:lipoate-protein ligase A
LLLIVVDGPAGVGAQMQRDAEALSRREATRGGRTVLRLFRIHPAGITLGALQRPEQELDLAACRDAGLEWARRPTGGRAILHDDEWTFSLLTELGADWAGDARSAYARTGRLLSAALRSLGVPAELAPAQRQRSVGPRAGAGSAPACFASTARHEVTVGGRKAVGIAQREQAGVLLQQGSILLGEGHQRLLEFQRTRSSDPGGARRALAARTAPIGGHLGADRSLDRLAAALGAADAALGGDRSHKPL